MARRPLSAVLPLTVTATHRTGCAVISKKNITKLTKNYDMTLFTSIMLAITIVNTPIIKVSCIYMHFLTYFTASAVTIVMAASVYTGCAQRAGPYARARIY